jgi:hypothetical protein
MRKFIFFIAITGIELFFCVKMFAQVSINTDNSAPHTSAMLDIKSTSKGLLVPRMTTAQRTTLGSLATGGLMVYDTDLKRYYYHNGTSWEIGSVGGFWSLTGGTNLYTTDLTNFVGIGTSTPATPLEVKGPFRTARLTSTENGTSLQFISAAATDFGIATWGSSFRIMSSTDNFISLTDEYTFTSGDFYPWLTNSKNLGTNANRWSTIFGINGAFSESLGIGTTTPATPLEVNGPFRTARLNSTDNGSMLQFTSTSVTDFSVGTWINSFRVMSSADNFTNITDEFVFTSVDFYPWVTNSKTLGTSTKRWSTIFGVKGTFSETLGIGTSTPATPLEVLGPLRTARLSSAESGAMLQFASSATTDFSVGTWYNTFRIMSSVDNFTNTTDEFVFSSVDFYPWVNNSKTLGITSKRWSTVFGVDGSFTGNAVVGGSSYLGKFHVHDDVNGLAEMYITPATTSSGDSSMLFLAEDSDASYGMYWLFRGSDNDMELWGRSLSTRYGPHLQIDRANGEVAIGSTFATGYKLSVSGKVICTELRVNLVANWPDYVFKPDYLLLPVEELGEYINANGHLPNVPPASEIEKSGMDVGEMQRLMMEKIEELSLYIVKQQQQIKELQDKVNNNVK